MYSSGHWSACPGRTGRVLAASAVLVLVAAVAFAPRLEAGDGSWSPIGPAGAEVKAVAVSPGSSSTLVAGTSSGYSVTTNGGASWSPVTTGYETSAIVFDPSIASIVYAATSAALARSSDSGATYVPVILEPTSCVAIDPATPSTVYAGTMDHVYKSTDRGLTWSPVYTGAGHSFVKAVAIDPLSPQTVWASMTFGGLQKSTNGGLSWSSAGASAPISVTAIVVHPATSGTVLALSFDGVYRTTDGGTTWGRVTRLYASSGALVADLRFQQGDARGALALYPPKATAPEQRGWVALMRSVRAETEAHKASTVSTATGLERVLGVTTQSALSKREARAPR